MFHCFHMQLQFLDSSLVTLRDPVTFARLFYEPSTVVASSSSIFFFVRLEYFWETHGLSSLCSFASSIFLVAFLCRRDKKMEDGIIET